MASIEDVVEPTEILKSLSRPLLDELFSHEIDDSQEQQVKRSKSDVISSLADIIENIGIKSLLENLRKDDIKKVAESYKGDLGMKEDDNRNSKAVLTKKLYETITKLGIDEFIKDNISGDLLKTLCEALDIEPISSNKDQLVQQIGHAVRAYGSESFWESFDLNLLKKVGKELQLRPKRTNSIKKLVEAILTKTELEKMDDKKKKKKKKKTKVVTTSKKKKTIEKGITYDDIFQKYNLTEVRDWCKNHGLKTTGKKKILIDRVLLYLEGDRSLKVMAKSSTGSASGGAGRKRKSTDSKTSSSSEKKKSTKKQKTEKSDEEQDDDNGDE